MQDGTYFDWRGRRCFYQALGHPDAPPVVLIHGHATSHFTWRHQVAALQADFSVFVPDLLGFGRSAKPRDITYTVELWTAQVTDFLEAVVRRPVLLAGNSLGGLIAACVADQRPDLVAKLVLIASAGAASYLQSSLVNFPFLLMRTPLLGRPLFDTLVQPRFVEWNIRNRLYANPAAVTPEVIAHYRECFFAPENREIVFEVTKQFYDFVMDDAMARRIAQPTLLVWGERDTFVPPLRGRQLLRVMPNARLEVLPNASHCPHEDQPEQVNTLLREFQQDTGYR
ncbi:MAG: alpha/beta fold hydrolase [Chloracidobacterium sp.]|uniref:Alpha/beta fold hydrolase n=1 Tax=Chloracidobacterium validum TaxID=2821543 RepID=A0ABX8B9R5_9BACT|nr:alpha/beta fold hydrolase [Chloracidobacterium validum]QUW02425.1 alpha/beta fold hydrolase [Chloracidobacterium validum]